MQKGHVVLEYKTTSLLLMALSTNARALRQAAILKTEVARNLDREPRSGDETCALHCCRMLSSFTVKNARESAVVIFEEIHFVKRCRKRPGRKASN